MMGANYKKPKREMEFDFIPKWMNVAMIICKWFIYTMPFVITSVMFFLKPEMTLWDNWLLTCVYLLSLVNIINMVNEK